LKICTIIYPSEVPLVVLISWHGEIYFAAIISHLGFSPSKYRIFCVSDMDSNSGYIWEMYVKCCCLSELYLGHEVKKCSSVSTCPRSHWEQSLWSCGSQLCLYGQAVFTQSVCCQHFS